jgi:polyferredoxin
VLLAIGLFSERAYCRFLCPLGGVLGVLDRLHLIDLLKRRPECGNPCRLCERPCPVRAIEKSGKIITADPRQDPVGAFGILGEAHSSGERWINCSPAERRTIDE